MEADLLNELKEKAKNGTLTPKEMQTLVGEFPNLEKKVKTEINKYLKQFQKKYEDEFVGAYTPKKKKAVKKYKLNSDELEVLDPLFESLKPEFKKNLSVIIEDLEIFLKNENYEIEDKFVEELGFDYDYAEAFVNTVSVALNRAKTFKSAIKHGVNKFKLTGPKFNACKFCKDKLDETFWAYEIDSMDNGQGLPVNHYVGGLGCPHSFIAIP